MTRTTELLVAHIAQPGSAPSTLDRALEDLSAQVLHFGDPCESLKRLPLHAGVVFLVERSALPGGGMMWLILLAEAHRGPVVLIEDDRERDPAAALRAGVQSVVYAPDFQDARSVEALVADAYENFERQLGGRLARPQGFVAGPRAAQRAGALRPETQALQEYVRDSLNEFRTPLTAVVEFASILDDGIAGALNEKQSEYAQHILDACSDLLEQFGDFRESTSLQLGREPGRDEAFNLLYAIEEALLQVRSTRVSFHIDACDESLLVRGERNGLLVAIARIAQRAAKCSKRGSEVVVRVRSVAGVRVEVAVIDQGPRATEGDISLLAEGTQQSGKLSKSVTQVFGVGMELARALLAEHGSPLEMSASADSGSQLSFSLPIAAA